MELYRGKYLIGVYGPIEEGETLLGLCSNVTEFAQMMHIRKDNSSQILSLLFNKKSRYLRFCDKECTVEFIELEEENDDLR